MNIPREKNGRSPHLLTDAISKRMAVPGYGEVCGGPAEIEEVRNWKDQDEGAEPGHKGSGREHERPDQEGQESTSDRGEEDCQPPSAWNLIATTHGRSIGYSKDCETSFSAATDMAGAAQQTPSAP